MKFYSIERNIKPFCYCYVMFFCLFVIVCKYVLSWNVKEYDIGSGSLCAETHYSLHIYLIVSKTKNKICFLKKLFHENYPAKNWIFYMPF